MGANTLIQWASHTFNPWRGCTKVATGCQNCYAESQSKRNSKVLGIWGPNGTRVVASEDMWSQPKKWNSDAERDGVRRRVFCASLADVFEDWNGQMVDSAGRRLTANAWYPSLGRGAYDELTMSHVRERLGELIRDTEWLDWLVLTKRPENIPRMFEDHMFGIPVDGRKIKIPNLWLGTSIACQEDADRNVSPLLKCRDLAPVLWLSVEPLVERVMLHPWIEDDTFHHAQGVDTDWVVVGGESGPNARPCNVEWIRSVVEQCQDTGVPVFVKQLGSQPTEPDGAGFVRHVMLRDKKGGDPSEWPKDLRVREFPGVASR